MGWMLALAIVVVAAIVAIFSMRARTPELESRPTASASQPTGEPSQSLRERLLNWPLPPAPPINVKVERPNVPAELPPVRMIDGQFLGLDLQNRLRVLVQKHPIAEVAQELDRAIIEQLIFLNWQTVASANAQFKVLRPEDITWTSETAQFGKFIPTLSIAPHWLARLQGVEGVLEGMLTVFHEFQHYKQWKRTPAEQQKMWLLEDLRIIFARFGPTACTTTFEREVEAYALECKLRNQWGLATHGTLCVYESTAHFRHATLVLIARLYPPGFLWVCGAHMARAAGHPNFQ